MMCLAGDIQDLRLKLFHKGVKYECLFPALLFKEQCNLGHVAIKEPYPSQSILLQTLHNVLGGLYIGN